MATVYLVRNGETWVSYWEVGVVPRIDAGTPIYHHSDGRTYIPLSNGGGSSWGGSSGGTGQFIQTSEGGFTFVSVSDEGAVVCRSPEGREMVYRPDSVMNGMCPCYKYVGGGSSGGGSSGGGYSGGSIQPGDYYHAPAWSPGPEWSPGPSIPHFDPPIRPPEERSGILFPLDVCWLLDTHEGQDEDIYARVDMDMGPARLRRKYTVVPHVRKAKIFLTFEESKVFHEWFEFIIGVGQLRWIGQFHDIGYGIRWFEAEFVKPWEAEYVALGTPNEEGAAGRAWKISIEVRLYGDGQIYNPLLDPNTTAKFKGSFALPLVTKNSPTVVNFLTARLSLPLTSQYSNVKLEASFSLPLDVRSLPAYSFSADFFTYLSSSAHVNGWERMETSFSLPLV